MLKRGIVVKYCIVLYSREQSHAAVVDETQQMQVKRESHEACVCVCVCVCV